MIVALMAKRAPLGVGQNMGTAGGGATLLVLVDVTNPVVVGV